MMDRRKFGTTTAAETNDLSAPLPSMQHLLTNRPFSIRDKSDGDGDGSHADIR
jgi:hypothetical protein